MFVLSKGESEGSSSCCGSVQPETFMMTAAFTGEKAWVPECKLTTLPSTSPVVFTPKCSVILPASPSSTSSPASNASQAARMTQRPRSNAAPYQSIQPKT